MRFRQFQSVLLVLALLNNSSVVYANVSPSQTLVEQRKIQSPAKKVREQQQQRQPAPAVEAGSSRSEHSNTAAPSQVLFEKTKRRAQVRSTHRKEIPSAPSVEKYLIEGRLADGEAAMLAQLKEQPVDDQVRFGLGMLQFLRAVEGLMQDFHRYGMRGLSTAGFGPFRRLPVPDNPTPETMSYENARGIAKKLIERLSSAEITLSSISDTNVKLPVHFGMIRFDFNNDGHASEEESLWKVYSSFSSDSRVSAAKAEDFYICFDRGDVHWLRGYCHLIMAFCQMYLAYDTKETFECTAHLLFKKVDTPYSYLNKGKHIKTIGSDGVELLDLIAFIHLIRWSVVEPARMEEALHDLEAVVAQSDVTWNFYMSETDDDREWIPNPKQKGVIPNVQVTDAMICSWRELMHQIDQVLAGKLLVPFWRGDDDRGVNVRRVFLEPSALDLVLWVQGPAAAPYLESGEKTKIDTWQGIRRDFGRQFPGFALWFN